MTNWRERAEQHLRDQERARLEKTQVEQQRRRELEKQRTQEIQTLWRALNVTQELRRINSQIWGSKGDVVVNDSAPNRKSVALVFRYQWPIDAGIEYAKKQRLGFHKEDVTTRGIDWGPTKIGERTRFGRHTVITGSTKYYQMQNLSMDLSVEVGDENFHPNPQGGLARGELAPNYYAVIVKGVPFVRRQKIIRCGSSDLSYEEVKEFIDGAFLEDCVHRTKYRKDYHPDGVKRKAEEEESSLRSRGYIRKY